MARSTKVTRATLEQAMNSPAVRAALRAKASRILPRAQRLAYQAGAKGFGDGLHLQEGTRPGAKAGGFRRPYARVAAEVTEEMKTKDAAATMSRQSILRRSSGA